MEDTILVEKGSPNPDSNLYELKGSMGITGQEQDLYVPKRPPAQQTAQPPQNQPPGIDPNFFQSAIKQIGFNPLAMNPVEDAMREFSSNERRVFNQVFQGTGITESSMTPEALQHWNATKKEILSQLTEAYKNKQVTGKAYLDYMTQEFDKQVNSNLREFESLHKHLNLKRGTPEYAQAYSNWKTYGQVGTSGGNPTENPWQQSGEKNELAITKLPPEVQNVVKQLVDHKIPLPGGFALKSPYWQNILQAASNYDPSFDATQYNTRLALRKDFTSGKSAQNIRSLNTAIGHLETLAEKAAALDNAPVQVWNWIKNTGLTGIGDKRVTEFNNAATAVESELANVFKGMGASDQEIKQWRKNLSDIQSPEQLKGAIDTAVTLLDSRLSALQSQYATGMGKPIDFKILSDKSNSIINKLATSSSLPKATTKGNAQAPTSTQALTVVERRKLPDGRIAVKYSDGTFGEER